MYRIGSPQLRVTPKVEHTEVERKGRRGFIRGMAVAAITALIAKERLTGLSSEETSEVLPQSEPAEPIVQETIVTEELKQPEIISTNSHWFTTAQTEVKEVLERDLELVLKRKRGLEDIITKYFSVAKIDSEIVRKKIEELILGVIYAESRFDVSAANGDAFGLFELTSDVWNQLAKAGDDMESVADQAKVAGRLFEQSYRHITHTCADELQKICTVFFGGNTAKFEEEFLTPACIAANTAGMGDVAMIIKWFTEECVPELSIDKIIEVLGGKVCPTGFDVFYLMSHLAYSKYLERKQHKKSHGKKLAWTKRYGESSHFYSPRVYAGYALVTEATEEDKM